MTLTGWSLISCAGVVILSVMRNKNQILLCGAFSQHTNTYEIFMSKLKKEHTKSQQPCSTSATLIKSTSCRLKA